jgi:hypothetical protein
METSAMAANLMNSKLWSQRRAMDRVGVDDPEQEQSMIREERTDATLFPADVQVMAQLMAVLQQLGVQNQQSEQAQGMAEQQAASMNDMRTLGGGMQGSPMMNGEEEQPMGPPEAMPANTPEGQALAGPPPPGAAAGPGGPEFNVQSMLQEGEAKNRILTQQTLGGK